MVTGKRKGSSRREKRTPLKSGQGRVEGRVEGRDTAGDRLQQEYGRKDSNNSCCFRKSQGDAFYKARHTLSYVRLEEAVFCTGQTLLPANQGLALSGDNIPLWKAKSWTGSAF